MPLETIDKDPFWSKRMRMSAEDMRRQKEAALAAGRDAWNAATRLGQNVKARTESELAELGRKALEARERAEATAKGAGQFIGKQIDAQREASFSMRRVCRQWAMFVVLGRLARPVRFFISAQI